MSEPVVVGIAGASAELGRRVILDGLDLVVGAGEIVAVVGANGSGKSTLLRMVVGLVRPRSGTVSLFGRPPGDADVLRRVGAAIDTPALYPWMSGRGVLRTLLDLSGEADHGRSRAALARFGLTDAGRKPVIRYSQGMRKRLALAAAAMREPELLVLDEPSNALDTEGRAIVRNWLTEHRQAGRSAIVATHRAGDVHMCDRVLRLHDGRLHKSQSTEWQVDPEADI